MEVSEVERNTRSALPDWADGELVFRPIEKGGSGRLFVRVVEPQTGRSLIAMHYSDDRSDNARFASITDFLNRHEIAAPEILARREDLGLLWVSDLGESDLGNLDTADWDNVRRPAYESALRVVFRLHSIREKSPPSDLPEMELSFDESLYEWEQSYFLNHFVARFGRPGGTNPIENPSLVSLRRELASLPRSLVHRDFQSTNVMIRDGETFLIDYQGLRWGLPEYDIASLLYDPYTEFTESEREHLVDFYWSLLVSRGDSPTPERTAFQRRLHQCAMQRLMQALGAYGYLSQVKGKSEFLQHIPTARRRLGDLADSPNGIPFLLELLRDPEA